MSNKPVPYLFWWILIAVAFCALPLFAATIEPPLKDPAQEARALHLFDELRCVVCAGQSLADSDTALAGQMRTHVRNMVRSGQNDEAILDYFTQTYGPSVRMSPPFSGSNAIIWLTPLLLLLFGAGVLWRLSRRPS